MKAQPPWPSVKIGDCCSLMTGGTPSRTKPEYFDGNIKWLVSGDIHKGEIQDCEGRISEAGVENSNARILPTDSVMIALNGQGKTRGTVAMLRTEAACNQSLVSIDPMDRSKLLPEFLYVNLRSRYDEIRKMTGDAGNERRGLNMRLIKTIEIPLAPLKEQKRIVEALEQAFVALDRVHDLAEANLADAKVLFPSILGQAFRPEAPWPIKSISDLIAEKIVERPIDGNHGETHPKKADFVDAGVPFIMASDLKFGSVDQENCYFLTRKQADGLRKGFAKDGDVLLSHKGTIGRAAILKTSLEYVMLTPQVTYYRVIDEARLDREFLFYCFQSADFQKQMTDIAGIGATRAYIGITRQHDLMMPLPGIETQRELVTKFKAAEAKAHILRGEYQEVLCDLDDLRQSLLQKAFAGELT